MTLFFCEVGSRIVTFNLCVCTNGPRVGILCVYSTLCRNYMYITSMKRKYCLFIVSSIKRSCFPLKLFALFSKSPTRKATLSDQRCSTATSSTTTIGRRGRSMTRDTFQHCSTATSCSTLPGRRGRSMTSDTFQHCGQP